MTKSMCVRIGVVGMILIASASGSAQDPRKISFEAASVRLGELNPPLRRILDGRVDFANVPLRDLLLMAHRLELNALNRLDAPPWVFEVKVNIQATYPAGAGREQVPEMLRSLLAERFGLVAHFESRPIDAYALVVGPGGIKMREVEPLDERARAFPADPGEKVILDTASATSPQGADNQRIIATTGGRRVVTARSTYVTRTTERGSRLIEAARMSMPDLAEAIAGSTEHGLVIDATGLAGVYQFTVELPELFGIERMLQGRTNVNGEPIRFVPSGVSVFEAVQSLGLRLEPRRTPVDILVIDKLERTPTEN